MKLLRRQFLHLAAGAVAQVHHITRGARFCERVDRLLHLRRRLFTASSQVRVGDEGEAKGRFRGDSAGDFLVGDESLQQRSGLVERRRGKADRRAGETKEKVERAKDKIEETIEKAENQIEEVIDKAKDTAHRT